METTTMSDHPNRAERREQMRRDIERAERHAWRRGRGDAFDGVDLEAAEETACELLDDDPYMTDGYDPVECLAWLIDSRIAVPVHHDGAVIGWTYAPRPWPDKSQWVEPPTPILSPWTTDGVTVDMDLLRAEVARVASIDHEQPWRPEDGHRAWSVADAIRDNLCDRPELADHGAELAAMVTALDEAIDRAESGQQDEEPSFAAKLNALSEEVAHARLRGENPNVAAMVAELRERHDQGS